MLKVPGVMSPVVAFSIVLLIFELTDSITRSVDIDDDLALPLRLSYQTLGGWLSISRSTILE